jgi:hypothetical protein
MAEGRLADEVQYLINLCPGREQMAGDPLWVRADLSTNVGKRLGGQRTSHLSLRC